MPERALEVMFQDLFDQEHITLPDEFKQGLAAAMVKAVEVATERATTKVAKRISRNTIALTATITALVTACISVPVTYEITHEGSIKASHKAATNCKHISALAAIEAAAGRKQNGNAELFERQSKDRLGLTPREFKALVRENREERDARVSGLESLARESCGEH